MADDDDDDSFGDYTFASNQTTANSSSQIPVTTGDDDDWGDFNFIGNNTTDHNNKSPQPHPQSQIQTPPKWEKIKGALPLSLFGGDEDEDEEPAKPVAGDGVKHSSLPGNRGFASNNNNNKSNAHVGINDLIADLYGQRQQQPAVKAADNGNGLDFTARSSFTSKDPLSKSDSFSSFSFHSVGASLKYGSDEEGSWEFMDAYSEPKLAQNGKDNKERSEKTVSPPSLQDGSHGPHDLFGAPNNGSFTESHVTDSGFESKPISNTQNGFTHDIKADFKDTPDELHSNSTSNQLGRSVDIDDSFGEFETAFKEQPSKKAISEGSNSPLGLRDASHKLLDLFEHSNGESHKDNKSKDDENFGKFETTIPEAGSKPEKSELSSKSYKEPVPLSIFGIEEEPEVDNSLNLQHELFKSSSSHGKHMRTHSSNLSINEILSDLYSQAEPISSKAADNDDDFDNGSWEFKDASPQSKVKNQSLSYKEKLNNFIDFYSKLKDELCIVARHHLHVLKKAQSTATLAGDDMKVAALDKEIQAEFNGRRTKRVINEYHRAQIRNFYKEAFEKLHQKDIISTEVHEDDDVARVISLEQYIKTLHEPEFLILDSEYNISRRLPLAESDLQTAIDLINHITTVLKILKLSPKGEPCNYVTEWFKVVSVCSQELKHGTNIWKQSLQKKVHSQILSQQKGKQFVNALGEIYRAVVILGAAVKFYKPWVLLSGADLEGLFGLLAECESLWSTSGLEEVLPAESLLESIRHIRNLDEFEIANEVFSQEESQCQLSLLSPRVVPGV